MVQVFAQSLRTDRELHLMNRVTGSPLAHCTVAHTGLWTIYQRLSPPLCWYIHQWLTVIYVHVACAHQRERLNPCIRARWPAHAVTCTYLEILHGQTRQLQRRNSLAQSSLSLLPLFLLVLLQHHRCHFQQLGLDWINSGVDWLCGIKKMTVSYYQL